jgi:hypothetical protein
MKILLGDFSAKVDREDIFKPTIVNESLHEINNDNEDTLVNFTTSKNLKTETPWSESASELYRPSDS